MSKQVLWLHEKALRSDLAFRSDVKVVHIWDEAYYQKRQYSFKRLFFIFETLCEYPLDILRGSTLEVMKELAPEELLIPYSADSEIQALIKDLSEHFKVTMLHSEPLAEVPDNLEYKRFFKYWNKAKKTAFISSKS